MEETGRGLNQNKDDGGDENDAMDNMLKTL